VRTPGDTSYLPRQAQHPHRSTCRTGSRNLVCVRPLCVYSPPGVLGLRSNILRTYDQSVFPTSAKVERPRVCRSPRSATIVGVPLEKRNLPIWLNTTEKHETCRPFGGTNVEVGDCRSVSKCEYVESNQTGLFFLSLFRLKCFADMNYNK